MERVAAAHISEQRGKAGPLVRKGRAADALVDELPVEGPLRQTAQRAALSIDRLAAGRHTVISNLTHSISSWG